jgi:integrase
MSVTLSEAFDSALHHRWAGTKNRRHAEHNARMAMRAMGGVGVDIERLTTADVVAARDRWLNEGLSGSTVNRRLSALSVMLDEARDLGAEPKARIKRAREGRPREFVFTPDQIDRLVARLPDVSSALVLFLAETGCRLGEALALTWADAGVEQVTFRDTKNGETRTIPLTARARSALERMTGREDGPWIGLGRWEFADDWSRARSRVGLPKEAVPHCLRHTFATRALAKSIPLERVRAWLGHKDVRTTLRYTHLTAAHLAQDVATLEEQ